MMARLERGVWRIAAGGVAVLLAALAPRAAAQTPLGDPLPDGIAKGDLVVAAIPFVRAPETLDTASPSGTNDPHARIQYLQAVPGIPGRLAFNDIRGVLYLTDAAAVTPTVYLDLRDEDVDLHTASLPNESGFMGFAFHPEFADPDKPGYGKLYTAFTATADSGAADYAGEPGATQASVIREWTANNPKTRAFRGTSRELLRVGEFAGNHNVGSIAFNHTADEEASDYGLLYICFGDGGSAHDPRNHGQGLAEPLGAIARIDPLDTADDRTYGIPADNPLVGEEGVAEEIWAYGLRHPQQFSWDADGRMFIADIGQNQIEEVNLGVAGANYGWRLREGTFATGHGVGQASGPAYPRPETDSATLVYPIAQYDHDEGAAIGGGFVYRGSAIPALQGKYVFTDFPRGRVFTIDADDLPAGEQATIEELRIAFDGEERDLVDEAGFPNTYQPGAERVDARLSVDHNGELYLLTKGDGWLRRLVANSADHLAPFRGRNTGDFNGDGKDDLLLRHRDGRWTYYPMNGRMNVTAERGSATLPADRAWRSSGVGDFNGDGDDDVLLRHADGRWQYYPMDGRRALASESGAPPLTRFPEWQIAGAGDFNGDAKDDVLVRHTDGSWYYYPLDGSEILTDAEGDAQVSRNLAWQLAGVGDFNGNGRHDVLLRNADGRWFYYPMYGRRHSVSGRGSANMTPNLDWQLAGIGDFNGDGRDDVMVRHTDGRWHYYPLRGRRTISGRGRANLPQDLAWQIATVGDFNGDGKDDILLRHTNGQWDYYPMNGRETIAAEQGRASITTDLDWSLP